MHLFFAHSRARMQVAKSQCECTHKNEAELIDLHSSFTYDLCIDDGNDYDADDDDLCTLLSITRLDILSVCDLISWNVFLLRAFVYTWCIRKIHFALCGTVFCCLPAHVLFCRARFVINLVNCVVCNEIVRNYRVDARTIEWAHLKWDGKPAQMRTTVGKRLCSIQRLKIRLYACVCAHLLVHMFAMKSATEALYLFMKNVRINWKMFDFFWVRM